MTTSLKAAAICAVAALVLAMPVVAQVTAPNPNPSYGGAASASPAGLQSNTSKATAGVFSNDVDDSMDVLWYTGVEFEKMAGFIGYGGDFYTNPISLGYATRFGSLYLGTWYTGNIARSYDITVETVTNEYDLDTQLQTTNTTKTAYGDNAYYTNSLTYSNNQIAALIGVSGMGIKIGFWESMYTSKNPIYTTTVTENITGGSTTYTNEIADYAFYGGHLQPSLEWGMKLPIGEGGLEIRPKVTASFDIYQDTMLINTKSTYDTPYGIDPGITSTGRNNGYLRPEISVGAGIGLPSAEGTSKSFDVSYGLGLSLYSNKYDAVGFSDTVKGTVNWSNATSTSSHTLASNTTNKNATFNIDEKTDMSHNIWLGFYYDKDLFENFKFGLYTAVDIGIGIETSDQYSKLLSTSRTEYLYPSFYPGMGANTTTTSEEIRPNTVEKTTSFSVAPILNLGAKYTLFPGRFSINAGIQTNPCRFVNSVTESSQATNKIVTTTKEVDDNGNVVRESVTVTPAGTDETEDSVTTVNTWSPFSAGLYGGFVFNFNDNASLDLAAGSAGGFTLDIATVNVLFTVKF